MSGLEEIISTALSGFNAFNTVAEVENTPYVVFQVRESPRKTRDGTYKYECNVNIAVVGNDFDECDETNTEVITAIEGIESDSILITSLDSQTTTEENNTYIKYNEYVISIKK
jgi:hypothetical protein